MQLVEAIYTTKGAHKTYFVKDETGKTIGTLDWLPTGEFVSYVQGEKRKHKNTTAALRHVVGSV